MRISFDLDETLFIDPKKNDIETEFGYIWKHIYKERLRKGTIDLFKYLKINKHEIWIYTTSFRSLSYIKRYFKKYGLILDGIVNGQIHQEKVQMNKIEIQPSKFPSKFRIDLHIDDDPSVKANGDILGFKVIILKEDDRNWKDKIINEIGLK